MSDNNRYYYGNYTHGHDDHRTHHHGNSKHRHGNDKHQHGNIKHVHYPDSSQGNVTGDRTDLGNGVENVETNQNDTSVVTNGVHTDSGGSGDGQNDQDNHDAKHVEGTVKDRKCRDITFLLIFVTFLGGMVCQNTLLTFLTITLKQRL